MSTPQKSVRTQIPSNLQINHFRLDFCFYLTISLVTLAYSWIISPEYRHPLDQDPRSITPTRPSRASHEAFNFCKAFCANWDFCVFLPCKGIVTGCASSPRLSSDRDQLPLQLLVSDPSDTNPMFQQLLSTTLKVEHICIFKMYIINWKMYLIILRGINISLYL